MQAQELKDFLEYKFQQMESKMEQEINTLKRKLPTSSKEKDIVWKRNGHKQQYTVNKKNRRENARCTRWHNKRSIGPSCRQFGASQDDRKNNDGRNDTNKGAHQ
ncbi:unnamed protein product [Owenia fusiformis]|uniref:Uncharacterized protein n=1 Tax=Owenia fusiformis TaxID=6347 RepID=A0A8S4NKL3_OWEFU|nr:unnamed protein product [Owenia fusiformis]